MTLRIAVTDPTALRKRCEVTTLRTTYGEPAYEDGAVIPATSWAEITDETAHDLTATAARAQDTTLVELVKPPEPADALATLTDRLGDPDALHLGQATAPAAALTTTPNHETGGHRIGLHVDNWDRLPYAEKHQGRRRLCLNLGPGTRYLLLGDLDIRAICRAVHHDYADRYPHTNDLRRYVESGHLVLCYRFRLEPSEGYIAPTELIPHDGSTQGQPEPSTAAFWLGHWPRGVLPSLA
ncbi:hypothetical protein [Streptomyces luteolus]|uniref:Uncharacterized protein n=1 Tax=Streptomyces luteolus TaxID=3043615 RepID=A0ABT6SZ45_9ACTN|nr:hypothetical protein [Streptomyces sp. B-S-A12]MDI3420398.1 hypothetical protein [Streptomyces sp. B-S-A12]